MGYYKALVKYFCVGFVHTGCARQEPGIHFSPHDLKCTKRSHFDRKVILFHAHYCSSLLNGGGGGVWGRRIQSAEVSPGLMSLLMNLRKSSVG